MTPKQRRNARRLGIAFRVLMVVGIPLLIIGVIADVRVLVVAGAGLVLLEGVLLIVVVVAVSARSRRNATRPPR